eukprot:TRINITY_DN26815_c0_g2_i1.p1 TRINITY_DN26815_c0_g2~~TRINITY_DN26815_c0_g2_i1.p1  ORF type:complete len:754 (-),score=201.40 TRINITY_DN26815_c0_g2_i1:423-2684(-)
MSDSDVSAEEDALAWPVRPRSLEQTVALLARKREERAKADALRLEEENARRAAAAKALAEGVARDASERQAVREEFERLKAAARQDAPKAGHVDAAVDLGLSGSRLTARHHLASWQDKEAAAEDEVVCRLASSRTKSASAVRPQPLASDVVKEKNMLALGRLKEQVALKSAQEEAEEVRMKEALEKRRTAAYESAAARAKEADTEGRTKIRDPARAEWRCRERMEDELTPRLLASRKTAADIVAAVEEREARRVQPADLRNATQKLQVARRMHEATLQPMQDAAAEAERVTSLLVPLKEVLEARKQHHLAAKAHAAARRDALAAANLRGRNNAKLQEADEQEMHLLRALAKHGQQPDHKRMTTATRAELARQGNQVSTPWFRSLNYKEKTERALLDNASAFKASASVWAKYGEEKVAKTIEVAEQMQEEMWRARDNAKDVETMHAAAFTDAKVVVAAYLRQLQKDKKRNYLRSRRWTGDSSSSDGDDASRGQRKSTQVARKSVGSEGSTDEELELEVFEAVDAAKKADEAVREAKATVREAEEALMRATELARISADKAASCENEARQAESRARDIEAFIVAGAEVQADRPPPTVLDKLVPVGSLRRPFGYGVPERQELKALRQLLALSADRNEAADDPNWYLRSVGKEQRYVQPQADIEARRAEHGGYCIAPQSPVNLVVQDDGEFEQNLNRLRSPHQEGPRWRTEAGKVVQEKLRKWQEKMDAARRQNSPTTSDGSQSDRGKESRRRRKKG